MMNMINNKLWYSYNTLIIELSLHYDVIEIFLDIFPIMIEKDNKIFDILN